MHLGASTETCGSFTVHQRVPDDSCLMSLSAVSDSSLGREKRGQRPRYCVHPGIPKVAEGVQSPG